MNRNLVIIISVVFLIIIPSIAFAAMQNATVLPAPAPDLTVSDIYLSPENPVLGQPVNITAIIANIGGATARNVTVDFCIHSEPVIIRKEIGDIPPHSERSVSINYIFLSAGSHTIIIKVDADNAIIEEDEMNNNFSMPITISSYTESGGGGGGGGGGAYYPPSHAPPGDTTPPLISNVSVTLGYSAIISWDTNEISDSLVKCGMKSCNYSIKKHNLSYTLSHYIHLDEINEHGTYFFVVNSTDPSGNSAQTPEYIFVLTPPSKEGRPILKIALPSIPYFVIAWWIALIPIIAALIISFLIYKRYKRKC